MRIFLSQVTVTTANFILLFQLALCRIHKLTIRDDYRSYIALTSFGFYKGGHLFVKLNDFHFRRSSDENESTSKETLFGFTLEKVLNDAVDPHLEMYREGKCSLSNVDAMARNTNENVVFFTLDPKNSRLQVNCSVRSEMERLRFYTDLQSIPITFQSEQASIKNGKYVDASGAAVKKISKGKSCTNPNDIAVVSRRVTSKDSALPSYTSYTTQFVIVFPTEAEEGLYELFFHNCANYKNSPPVGSYFNMIIEEYNVGSFLSAGEMPLPPLYFTLSIIFFLSALFWIYILVKSRQPVFKIHYLMAALIFLKSLGLFFHSINYHYIELKGEHVAAWAILYYVTHLLKGSVLFITIILIGTGWTFIKHILTPKDKKIFMIVIPLQVFSNVSEIILEESEEGDAEHKMWMDAFIFVDLICCFAILFPIVWSIKHLQDASHTDGKAAINLRKLKLFQHFYIMIVCYVYFTRIIAYLLKMTVPFQYAWLDEMFREIATFVFFVLTGYKFRPAAANPYFQLAPEEEDISEMDLVVRHCGGLTEGLTKLSKINNNDNNDEDREALLSSHRESSHDYD